MRKRNRFSSHTILLFTFLLLSAAALRAQGDLLRINGWNAYVHLPDDYSNTTKTYPVIIFLPGIGEVGSDPNRLLSYGPNRFVAQGHNMQFTVNGVVEKPIVISMQPPSTWPSPAALNRQLDSIIRRWRVNINRISFTGLSMGGSSWDNYINTSPLYALRPASVVAMSAPPPANPLLTNFAIYAATGGKWWGFEGTQDGRYMWLIRDIMNLTSPGSAKYTHYVGGHCCWNNWYDPNYRENGENIYEWMLKQVRTPILTPNQPPIASAGNDQVITLPLNTVTLNGTATDNDGTINTRAWTKISGPGSFTITSPSSAQTSITNLSVGVYAFRFAVTDNSGASDADTVRVTVNAAVNIPPVADAGADQSITLPVNTVTLSGTGSDQDGTISSYAWTKVSGPAAFTIISPSAAQTTITNLAEGVYQFRLQVTDNAGAVHADNITLTVNPLPAPPNIPPVAEAGADQSITLPLNSVTLAGSGTDADGTVVAYTWSRISGPGQHIIATPNAALTTVSYLVAGTYQFRLQVRDNDGALHADTVTVLVNPGAAPPPPNVPPTVDAGNDQSFTLPGNVTLTGSADDEDGTVDEFRWTKIDGPDNYTITSPTQAITTITGLEAGEYRFRLQVTDDDGATAADTVTIIVLAPANVLPTAIAGNDITLVLPANSTTVTGRGTDSDGTITAFSWSRIAGPAQHTIANPGSAQTIISNLAEGTYRFRLQVTDNDGAIGADTLTIQVNAAPIVPPANVAPVADAGPDQVITLPTNSVTLIGSGTDTDGTVITYRWTKIAGPAATIVSASSSATIVRNLVEGTYRFRLLVTDDDAASGADTVTVIVNTEPNTAPVAIAGDDIEIVLPANSVILTGSGTDVDGVVVSYNWSKVSGPESSSLTSLGGGQTVAAALEEGVYQFRLEVRDDDGATGTDTIRVTVTRRPNEAPIAFAATAREDVTLPHVPLLEGIGNDADGYIVSQKWRQLSGPSTARLPALDSFHTEVRDLEAGDYVFEFSVTDNEGAIGRDTVLLKVNPVVKQSTAIVFPNPAAAVTQVTLRISSPTMSNLSLLRVLDLNGKVVHQETFMRTESIMNKQLDISRLQPGTYFIEVGVDINTRVSCTFMKR
ncbi:MAG: T9SS type A sorting domain-containing protein [Chitinophagaceae bacterium]|nr:MAG: T9SS type A sorting domain-containing protein [Chitinophagaceae bacterium]